MLVCFVFVWLGFLDWFLRHCLNNWIWIGSKGQSQSENPNLPDSFFNSKLPGFQGFDNTLSLKSLKIGGVARNPTRQVLQPLSFQTASDKFTNSVWCFLMGPLSESESVSRIRNFETMLWSYKQLNSTGQIGSVMMFSFLYLSISYMNVAQNRF